MQKKKFDLTSDIVEVKLEEKPIDEAKNTILSKENEGAGGRKANVLLTISVDTDKRTEFKTWCAKNNLKMNEAFLKGFDLLKREH